MRGTEVAEAPARQPDTEPVPVLQERIQVSREVRASAPIRTALPEPNDPEPTVQAGAVVPEISIVVREGPTGVRAAEAVVLQGATGVRAAEAAVLQGASGVLEEAVRPEVSGAVVAVVALQADVPVDAPVEGPEDVEISVNSRFKKQKYLSQ